VKKRIYTEVTAEFFGTFLLVFIGCGAVGVDVIAEAHIGLVQVAILFGLAINLAIFLFGSISGAHINPAITIAMAVFRKDAFPARKIVPYILSQFAGAFFGAAVLYALMNGTITHFEAANHIIRGSADSQLSAMMFGEYFPNPAIYGTTPGDFSQVSTLVAFFAEFLGTLILALFIFAFTDRNFSSSTSDNARYGLYKYLIGLVAAVCIILLAPYTQAGFNPARDFGPRVFSYFAGWGPIAIPGPRGGFFIVYILSPIFGALAGGSLYKLFSLFNSRTAVQNTTTYVKEDY